MDRLDSRRLWTSYFYLKVVHRASIKRQTIDALSQLTSNGKDKSQLKDDITLLMIDKSTPEETPTSDEKVALP